MTETEATEAPSIVAHLKRDANGKPFLQGSKCAACSHTFVGEREICARCYARDAMAPVALSESGKLYAYTIVHRSFPGVETPFIDIIADLDDGSHIKGILKDVPAELDNLKFDMPVRIDYREVVPPGSNEKYLAYFFVPDAA